MIVQPLRVDSILSASRSIPGVYPLLAFLTARRIVVRGPSMYPTLRPGDRILFDRLAYKVDDPQPGDVVLARHPSRSGVLFIKRIASSDSSSLGIRFQPDTGEGAGYHLLGDNPDASTDSRTLGPFRREDVLAKAWLIYWPRDRFRRL